MLKKCKEAAKLQLKILLGRLKLHLSLNCCNQSPFHPIDSNFTAPWVTFRPCCRYQTKFEAIFCFYSKNTAKNLAGSCTDAVKCFQAITNVLFRLYFYFQTQFDQRCAKNLFYSKVWGQKLVNLPFAHKFLQNLQKNRAFQLSDCKFARKDLDANSKTLARNCSTQFLSLCVAREPGKLPLNRFIAVNVLIYNPNGRPNTV